MGIVIVFQYKGEKARFFDVYRDDESKYLDRFFRDDLRRLRIPAPQECHLKAWRASRILCKWDTWGYKVCMFRVKDMYVALMLHGGNRICTTNSCMRLKMLKRGRMFWMSLKCEHSIPCHESLLSNARHYQARRWNSNLGTSTLHKKGQFITSSQAVIH